MLCHLQVRFVGSAAGTWSHAKSAHAHGPIYAKKKRLQIFARRSLRVQTPRVDLYGPAPWQKRARANDLYVQRAFARDVAIP